MTEAYVFDAIRTPRGKGKKDGSLHEVKPINLLTGLLTELQRRNGFDTARVDDVVMGVVSPVGEQGSVIAKTAALKAGWDWTCSGVQINRFCASGLEAVNLAAQKVRSGWEDLVVAGGVESMSRVPMGSDGGAWAQDPETNSQTGLVPQGIGADLDPPLGGLSRQRMDPLAGRASTAEHTATEAASAAADAEEAFAQVAHLRERNVDPALLGSLVEIVTGLETALGRARSAATALEEPIAARLTLGAQQAGDQSGGFHDSPV